MVKQDVNLSELLTEVAQKVSRSAYDRGELIRGACVESADRILAAFLNAMNTQSVRSEQLRVVMDGVRVPPYYYSKDVTLKVSHSDLIDRGQLNKFFRRGATILMDDAQTAMPQVLSLCELMSEASGMQVAGTIFCSPPHADGFALHQDAEDVVVIQLQGAKEWLVYPQLDSAASSMLRGSEVGDPLFRSRLEPGDVLIMPKGSPHKTISNASTGSIHLTLGMYHVTYRDLLNEILKRGNAAWLDSPTTGFTSEDIQSALVSLEWEWVSQSEIEKARMAVRRRMVADGVRFEPLVLDNAAQGGRYRLLGSAGRAMQLLLASQLERSESEIGVALAALSALKKGDSFDYVELSSRLEDPVVAEEVLHALLRLRLVVRDEEWMG